MGDAFQSVAGIGRYKWMQDLGNESILTGEQCIRIRRPSAANELLDEAVNVAEQNRRLIFFCSCELPYWDDDFCHRTTVTSVRLKTPVNRADCEGQA